MDGRYPKHLATISANPGTTGGSATHTHTQGAHTHSITHSHTAAALQNEDTTYGAGSFAVQGAGGTLYTPAAPHQHSATLATQLVLSGSTASIWDTAPNDAPYYAMIWIQSDGTPTGIPPNACVLWNTQTVPANWIQHVASKGRYLRGAAAGADGGVTGGDTHNHTSTTSHSHTGTSHAHGGTSDQNSGGAWGAVFPASTNTAPYPHTHGVADSAAVSGALNAGAGQPTSATAVAVPSVNLTVIQNSQSTNQQPVGLIALWLGTLATIPGGWNQVTSIPTDRFIKATSVLTTVNQKAGVLGHTHAGGAGHTHTQNFAGHAHGVTLSAGGQWIQADVAGSGSGGAPSQTVAVGFHGHTSPAATSSTNTTGSNAVAPSVTAIADDRPLYTEVAFIQYGGPMSVAISSPTGGAVLATSSPAVAWALSGSYVQNDYRLFVYAADGVTVVYDSGRLTSAALSATVPSGFLQSGQTYVLQVVVDDTQGDNALSPQVTVTTSWSLVPSIATITTQPVGGQ